MVVQKQTKCYHSWFELHPFLWTYLLNRCESWQHRLQDDGMNLVNAEEYRLLKPEELGRTEEGCIWLLHKCYRCECRGGRWGFAPPTPWKDRRLSKISSVLQKDNRTNKKQRETRLKSFLSDAPPLKKNTGSVPVVKTWYEGLLLKVIGLVPSIDQRVLSYKNSYLFLCLLSHSKRNQLLSKVANESHGFGARC